MDILKAIAMTAICGSVAVSAEAQLVYPAAPADGTSYQVNGVTVNDPYRPLENDTAAATLQWVEAENVLTRAYLDQVPYREAIRSRLTALNNYRKCSMPHRDNDGRYYFYDNDGLRNQAVLFCMDSIGAEPRVFLDPNTLSDDGTVALTGVYLSGDGRYTAYTVSRSGSDWCEIFVMETSTGRLLTDHIEWAKFTGAAWAGDGFYYSAYDRPEAGKEFSMANEFHRVYFHRLGTSQADDVVVFEDRNQPLHFHSVEVSDDESTMFIYGAGEGHGNSLWVRDLRRADSKFVLVEPSQDYDIQPIDVVDGYIYFYTSVDAKRYRVVKAPVDAPQRANWVEVVPEQASVLVSVQFAGDKLILVYAQDAAHHAYIYTTDGQQVREIRFPTYGSTGFSCSRKQLEVFYAFTSFTYPTSIYRYDMASGESTLYRQAAIEGFNPEDYVTEQVFFTSTDGTRVPMFVVRRADLKPDGTNPTYMYGYGGFNVPLYPNFSANRLYWLEQGGIFVYTNLRGGAEYGDDWHEAGTKMHKLNVFNDFICAAEHMIAQGWTTKDLLVCEGGSNGGLLVGAVVNMRPDLYRVAIPRVGVMDMMRYHLFTIGWNWAHDYGTANDSPEMAAYLHDYSPIHNVRNDGTLYPSILVTTADHDDRVVPAHSFKYAATLQASNIGDRPHLIRIDSKAGHGAGKPISKVIDEWVDIYSFIFANLSLTPAN